MASKAVIAMLVLLISSGCGAPPARHKPGAVDAAPVPAGAAPVSHWNIDPDRSELEVRVYRAGPMARLGHNHVLMNRALSGWAEPPEAARAGAFFIAARAADFVVDDAPARAAAGADFAAPVGDDAKAGTRSNLLGPGVLDAERFPDITLRSVSIARDESAAQWLATVEASVAGHVSTLRVPFALELAAQQATGSGTAVLRQSDLGLTPFSLMLGALRVQDEITVQFHVTAVRSP